MDIELDIFSGRPNPRWELDEASSQILQQLQNQLKPCSRASEGPPALGYRGFWFWGETGRAHAYHGYIQTKHAILDDPSCSIERFLLEQIPDEFAALRWRIEPELPNWGDDWSMI